MNDNTNIVGNERPASPSANGLTDVQVAESRSLHGDNVLTPPSRPSLWRLYIDKFDDPIIRILLVAAVLSLVLGFVAGDFTESIGIFMAVFLSTGIGFYFEHDASRKFDVLMTVGEEQAVKVVRNGCVCEVARRDVVVGDVVLLEGGDEVPADGRLTESVDLQVDESALTGEPLAYKHAAPGVAASGHETTYPPDVVLRSTMVTGGVGRMVVTAVGDATEIGRVAGDATVQTGVKTPLNMQLDRLAALISRVGTGVAVSAFVLFLGHDIMTDSLWHTSHYVQMAEVVLRYFMMAVTLIVMAVPEGLPMAVTLALALNMRRMLKSNNLVRKLHACETMGAVTVICTDKTGTLTQNRMTVADMAFASADDTSAAAMDLSAAVNSTAELDGDRGIGNPTEVALLRGIKDRGGDYKALRGSVSVADRLPFSTERKYMSTLYDSDGTRWLAVKGAPEVVMSFCDMSEDVRRRLTDTLTLWQNNGFRTLAFARKRHATALDDMEGLAVEAVVAIEDPVRREVPEAVAGCRQAGIGVKMVTGDTSATAVAIGRKIGILPDDISAADLKTCCITGPEFAALSDEEALERVAGLRVMSRARPSDKQRLVALLQRRGEVVAVTGDGTNDAPALNRAHVGLSLGSGTSVAKNASDMTLIDDSFRSIVSAVEWGRSLYNNIRRFIFFQLVVNVTALLLMLGCAFISTELPFTVPQMLWVNLIMDTFAAMALASLPPEGEVMGDKPRRQGDFIISRRMAVTIGATGLLFFAVLFALFCLFKSMSMLDGKGLTVFFTIFVMLQWWNLFNAKAFGSKRSVAGGLLKSRGLFLVLAIILVGQWLIVTFGGRVFRTVPLDFFSWVVIVAGTSPVLIAGEAFRFLTAHFDKKKRLRKKI